MRAILIDPEAKTFTEIDIAGDYRATRKVLKCKSYTTGACLSGSLSSGFDSILVSDDLLDEREDPRFWFQVDAEKNPPSSFPIAGLGLAVGTDTEGGSCDARISVDELKKRVTFTQRKFRDFEVSSGESWVSVGVNAPIVDGTTEN